MRWRGTGLPEVRIKTGAPPSSEAAQAPFSKLHIGDPFTALLDSRALSKGGGK